MAVFPRTFTLFMIKLCISVVKKYLGTEYITLNFQDKPDASKISQFQGRKTIRCVIVLIEKCFRSPSRDSEKHYTGELFYFLMFTAGEDEHFTVCFHYFDSILAGSLKMLREKFL